MATIEQMTMFDKQFDSKEEALFESYLNELSQHGFIHEAIYHPEPIVIAPERSVQAFIRKKNKNQYKSVSLCKGVLYEPDWRILWTEKAQGVVTWSQGGVYDNNFFPYRKSHRQNFIPFFSNGGESLIDVKGSFAGRNNSSAVTFGVKQKVVLQQYGLYVQKVVVSLDEKGIFYRTFFPRSVVYQEVYKKDYTRNGKLIAKQGDSKIKCEVKLIEKWLKERT